MQRNSQPDSHTTPASLDEDEQENHRRHDRHFAEQRYTHFFTQAPTMLVITQERDGSAYISDCNDLFQNTLGYTRKEIIGRPLADFYCPESRDALVEGGYRQALQGGIVDVERNLVRKDGSLVPTILRASPITDEAGKVWGTHVVYIDIQTRKEADAALRESDSRLRRALDAAQMGIWEWDIRTHAVTWSDKVERMFGLSPDQLPGTYEAYRDLVHPDDRSLVEAEVARAFKIGVYSAIYRLVWPDGSVHWQEAKGRVAYDDDAQPVRMYGTIMDVTERVLADERLRRFRVALDSSADGIFLVDPVTMKLIDVNDTACIVLGYTREELLQLSVERLLPTLDTDELVRQFDQLTGGVNSYGVMELDLHTKDGAILPVEAYLRAFAGQDGPIIVASGRNIRERRAAEAALQQERALLSERVEQRTAELQAAVQEMAQQAKELRRITGLQDAILTYGGTAIFSTAPDGVIRTFNPAAEQLFGVRADEAIDTMAPVTAGDSAELSLEPVSALAQDRQIAGAIATDEDPAAEPGEWTVVRQDSARTPVVLSVTELSDEAGNPIGFAYMAQDISLQKESEQALRRSEEMLRTANAELARALRLKDEFLANMSHELRTPLNAILNLSESLAEEIVGPLNDKQRNFCQLIMESGQHLLSLINDILDLSKIEAGRSELELVPIAVEPVCQSSLRMVNEQAKKKRLTSSLHMDPRVQWVHADARQLKQMLVNLLTNAVKFTPRGGKIGIDVSADPRNACISFTVWDTGIGISQDDMQRLFQPFVQLDSGLSRQYGGSGLGLALVLRMARVHGGGVRVESTPGEGSRFTIDLPMVDPALDPSSGEEDGEEPDMRRGSAPPSAVQDDEEEDNPLVLLVDNTEAFIVPAVHYLEAHGYRVAIAYQGQEAIAQARKLQPDCILMDIQMPDIDGLEAARWIRSEPWLESTPIIALTALAMPGDRERCLAGGMDDYLAKPLRLRDLLRHIEAVLATQEA